MVQRVIKEDAPERGYEPAVLSPPPPLRRLPASRNPFKLYVRRMRPGRSRATVRYALEGLARLASGGRISAAELAWEALDYEHTAALREALVERYEPAGVNLRLSVLRGVLRESWRLRLIDAEQLQRASDVVNVRGSVLPRGRHLMEDEVELLFRVCDADEGPAGARDAAIFAVLYGCGLRRAELVALDLEDYDPRAGCLHVDGKGGKARAAFLPTGAGERLEAWLSARGRSAGPVFMPIDRLGRIQPRRLTTHPVARVCRVRGEAAGVAPFTPHDLRRSFVSELLDQGADIAVVQRMAGHSKTETTVRYDRRGDRATKRAARLVRVPDRQRGDSRGSFLAP